MLACISSRLDLDAWINEPIEESSSESEAEEIAENLFVKTDRVKSSNGYKREPTEEDIRKVSIF